jgi:hypothetical protein
MTVVTNKDNRMRPVLRRLVKQILRTVRTRYYHDTLVSSGSVADLLGKGYGRSISRTG